MLVSEENEEPILVEGLPHARYAVVFDPLDGYIMLTACLLSIAPFPILRLTLLFASQLLEY